MTNILLENIIYTLNSNRFLIFLGGVHGVGKSTLCNEIFTKHGYPCVTASSLIKSYTAINQDKTVKNIEDNQQKLLTQLALEKKRHEKIVLDGHYCIINLDKEIIPIELNIFSEINPSALLLLKDCPKKIVSRLKNRDLHDWDESFIKNFQEAEESHAIYLSKELQVPLQIISNYICN